TGSAGYRFDLANNWFIEPSAGVVWSRTHVDPLFSSGTQILADVVGAFPPSILQVNTFDRVLGRFGIRVGTTFAAGDVVPQPVATAAVWREFAGNVTTTVNGSPIANGIAVNPDFIESATTSRVGTYGQFGLGLAGQIVNTGWLGYARVDFREGQNIDGI